MKDQLGIKMDKKKIELKSAIKNEGEFTAKIRLFAGVAADLKVIVTIA
jgi:ribosomal protein L9